MALKNQNERIIYAISLAIQLGFLIAFTLIIFIGGGFLLDKYLGTLPLFLLCGLFLGLILSFYEIYKLLLPLIKSR